MLPNTSTNALTKINGRVDHFQYSLIMLLLTCPLEDKTAPYMETYCNDVIAEILAVQSEAELIKVISESTSRLRRIRNPFNEYGYLMNMIVSLRAMDQKGLPKESIDNITLAIAIFRQIQKDNKERIF
jgi:hypothetical protein